MSVTGPHSVFPFSKEKKSTSRVGKDVLGFCSRCKMNLMHTVVTVGPGDKPDRVQCNTCKSERTYRAPKDASELRQSKSSETGGKQMTDREEELDLDNPDVTKVLLGESTGKKKPKAKAKSKKSKDDEVVKSPSKPGLNVPLSMQAPSADDLAQFETKFASAKSAISDAKPYKATERYRSGDLINHKTFGVGFVLAESGLNKIEVLFREGRKLLVTAPK